jgi:hypothetical protein
MAEATRSLAKYDMQNLVNTMWALALLSASIKGRGGYRDVDVKVRDCFLRRALVVAGPLIPQFSPQARIRRHQRFRGLEAYKAKVGQHFSNSNYESMQGRSLAIPSHLPPCCARLERETTQLVAT